MQLKSNSNSRAARKKQSVKLQNIVVNAKRSPNKIKHLKSRQQVIPQVM